jgi:hypothetical protein
MWKTCQAFPARYQSVPPHSTPLPPLYPQRILAVFLPRLGILIIGDKKQKRPRLSAAFPFLRGESPYRKPTPYLGQPRGSCQNPQAKSLLFSSLPQSKRTLQEPLRKQALATVPTQEGRGVGAPHFSFSELPAPGSQLGYSRSSSAAAATGTPPCRFISRYPRMNGSRNPSSTLSTSPTSTLVR